MYHGMNSLLLILQLIEEDLFMMIQSFNYLPESVMVEAEEKAFVPVVIVVRWGRSIDLVFTHTIYFVKKVPELLEDHQYSR